MTEFLNLLLPWWWGPINWITDSFISVIVLCAIVSGIWFGVKTSRRRRLIDSLTKEIGQYSRSDPPSIKQELTGKFNRNTELADAWQEFEDSLITRSHNENQIVYKTDEASLFFSEERLLEQHLNLRFWNSVPALLVGLGILGTFVGMVWGLIPFSDVDFTDTNEIREAIKELLSGVSTAFVTSVWGMFASFWFNGLEKWGISSVSRAIVNLQRALDQIFTLTRGEEIAIRQQDELEQQTAALKSFSTDLADRIKIAMDNIMSERLKNLHQSLTQLREQNAEGRREIIQELHSAPEAFSSAMAEQLTPSLNNLNTAVKELREQKEESSTDAIRQLVEEFQGSISGSVTAQMEELARTVGSVSQSLMNLPGQMEQMVDRMLNTFQGTINAQQAGLKAISNQSIQTLETAIDKLGKAIASTVSEQQRTISEITVETRQASTKATGHMKELVDRATTQLEKSVRGAEESINKLLQQQGTQIKAFNAQITNSQATLTRSREILEQMNASVISVRQLIDTTKTLSERLREGATRLESAGTNLTQASNAFNRENKSYLIANRETTTQIQNVLGQSQQLLNDSVQRFRTIDNGLQGIFAEIERGMNGYATTARESINTYLIDFSNQLTLASTALAGSVEALGENVEILTDMIERPPRR